MINQSFWQELAGTQESSSDRNSDTTETLIEKKERNLPSSTHTSKKPNQPSPFTSAITTTYMQKITVTTYPNGKEYQTVQMWKVGAEPKSKTSKKKPKKTAKKAKIQPQEDY